MSLSFILSSYIALPSLIVRPQPESVLTGADIIIECIATGLPTPSVKWVRLNKTDSTNATVSNNGSLIINNSTLSDTGDYVCVATTVSNNGILIINNSSLSKPESVLTGAGDYVCVATNIVGKNTAQIPIEVKDPTGMYSVTFFYSLILYSPSIIDC